jgi:YaiO family outer membrane protein
VKRGVRFVTLAALLTLALPAWARGQQGWAVDFGTQQSWTQNNGHDTLWTTRRVQASLVREGQSGLFGGVERHERDDLVDVALFATGYRRLGDWTVGGGMAATPSANYLYRFSLEGEVSRRVSGTLVATISYRYLDYPAATVNQVSPAATWYHARGEVAAKFYVTRNVTLDRTSITCLVRAIHDVGPRLRLGGGASYGDRTFDVASLASGPVRAWVVYGNVRVGLTHRDFVDLSLGAAHEAPAFHQTTLALAYRRVF